eukprot:6258499-Amphidinium_carterae.1
MCSSSVRLSQSLASCPQAGGPGEVMYMPRLQHFDEHLVPRGSKMASTKPAPLTEVSAQYVELEKSDPLLKDLA